MYNKKVIDIFQCPKNMGDIKDADAVGRVGNASCGDIMEVFIKVDVKDGEEYIKEVKVKTFGCVAAIATSSIMTEMVKGKTFSEIEHMTNKDVADELGGLPPLKLHCSNLSVEALHKAIENYKKQKESK